VRRKQLFESALQLFNDGLLDQGKVALRDAEERAQADARSFKRPPLPSASGSGGKNKRDAPSGDEENQPEQNRERRHKAKRNLHEKQRRLKAEKKQGKKRRKKGN
jgi:hypothetical protein